MSIAQNIEKIRQTLPARVRLVCVSKYHTAEDILEAYKAGERDFAESRAQELQLKAQTLPKDIHWHFIGHLQRNKAKLVCQYVSMIQSVDSMRLIETLNSVSEEPIDILLEVHIAQEATKTGFSKQELINLLSSTDITQFSNIRIRGLMAMATQTNNRDEIQHEFHEVKLLFDYIKTTFFPQSGCFDTLSMGMSDDYDLAIEEGCNMVRIGSRIFS
ncbi:MAG: YggS family pyridoxal phosphate-dependent enzyme [Paludibacteraceae bacterium]|nr:YggS family pyridoxal phosphate-dependent enzyme [Paludibacteraceae bacterium]